MNEQLTNSDTLRMREDMVPIWEDKIQEGFDMTVSLPEDYEETAYNYSFIDSKSYAAYLSGSYEFSERIRLNVGMRYSREEKNIEYYQGCDCLDGDIQPMSLFVAALAGNAEASLESSLTNNTLTRNIGVDFKTTDKILIYINARIGISTKNERFGIALWGKNFTNATYVQHD
ncbi:MAG: opacity protein-like surface antigen [Saprospiraceae bacterium]|jgi:opacity protein-like surface antigen